METLNGLGVKYGTDKSVTCHNYLEYYDKQLSNIRDNQNNILEIGILFGQSTKMFKEYFKNSTIYAFDIEDKTSINEDRIKVLIGDQSDRNFLNSFEDDFFDVILDDGSHRMDHQQISIGGLFKKLKSGGIYILEDLHTSDIDYVETKQHGLSLFGLNDDGSNNTISFLKGLLTDNGYNHYLTIDEYNYLKSSIYSIDIKETASRSVDNRSITSIIIKK